MTEGFGGQESHGGGRVGGIGRGGKSGRGGGKKEASASKGKLVPPVDKVWAEKWRKELKIAGVSMNVAMVSLVLTNINIQRQFQRLVEMLILLHLDPSDSVGLRAYRLHVKERLYRFNFVCVTFVFVPPILTYWVFRFLGNSGSAGEGGKTR